MNSSITINSERLQQRLEAMAGIGCTQDGGVSRLALSDADAEGRRILAQWFEEQGCSTHIDPMGNMFFTFAGKDSTLPPLLTGSHNDTQPNGGRFDGTLGILAGLEIISTLRDHGITLQRDLIIVNWTNEEGSRFSPGCTGSGVWAGQLDRKSMYTLCDQSGKKLHQELQRTGFLGNQEFTRKKLHAAVELHIEQGPVLDREGIAIGIPEGIVSPRWYTVQLTGETNHAGSTPMKGRKDALYAFARMCSAIHDVAADADTVVATVGHIQVTPNSLNVIPGKVEFTMDIRGWDVANTDSVCTGIEKRLNELAEETGCSIKIKRFWEEARVDFNPQLLSSIEQVCQERNLSCKRMYSGANHDMIYVSKLGPGAMIFVPSTDGKSHCPQENTRYEDCAAGVNVLLHTLLKIQE
ncbi:M20 family metallo-hydrolase [Desulfogranum japonicum]|uniref:M20 family metallo-hydrolase n=1 Tax=Desulfogranum japonicum TaxID=231447 RepID=UPI000429C659|nr:M20 family metallo-hydrolase [Desulfogranum japonicum]